MESGPQLSGTATKRCNEIHKCIRTTKSQRRRHGEQVEYRLGQSARRHTGRDVHVALEPQCTSTMKLLICKLKINLLLFCHFTYNYRVTASESQAGIWGHAVWLAIADSYRDTYHSLGHWSDDGDAITHKCSNGSGSGSG